MRLTCILLVFAAALLAAAGCRSTRNSIRDLHGSLLRTSKGTPPTFDDKRSFIIGINSGTVRIGSESLSSLMNDHVFAYPHAPLKKIRASTKGNQIKPPIDGCLPHGRACKGD
jgi:hypothetical protein